MCMEGSSYNIVDRMLTAKVELLHGGQPEFCLNLMAHTCMD